MQQYNKEEPQTKKIWLNEVSFMRPILLVLLVSFHAFAPWCGAWQMPDGCHDVEIYRWLAYLSRAFRLEAFVFISGYIFTFQLLEKKKYTSLGDLALNKAKRLLIPCFFFGIIYFIIFGRFVSVWKTITSIGGGIAHLWYLTCLFWCFLFQYIIITKQWCNKLTTLILIIICTISVIKLPVQIDKAMYYMLFFYGGGLFYQNMQQIANISSKRNTLIMWTLFAFLFLSVYMIMQSDAFIHFGENGKLYAGFAACSKNVMKATLAWVGITAFYMTAVRYCSRHTLSDIAVKIGTCGYGVYVFHQFVLKLLYNNSSFSTALGSYWTPWVALFVTIVSSISLTLLLRQTKIGRKYL